MDWTVSDYSRANHNPVVEVNGRSGTAPLTIDAVVGQPLTLDATRSHDPDGQSLHYSWYLYPEAGSTGTNLSAVTISGADTATAVVTPTAVCRPMWLLMGRHCSGNGAAHIILAVTDDGSPQLTSYRRVILNVHLNSSSTPKVKH